MKTIRKDINYVEITNEEAKRLRDEIDEKLNPDLRVPENIKFSEESPYGLIFNDGKQELYYTKNTGIWSVIQATTPLPYQPKLVPCEKADIKVGDWFYVFLYTPEDLDDIENYQLMLDDDEYVEVTDKTDVTVYSGNNFKNYWKVVFEK